MSSKWKGSKNKSRVEKSSETREHWPRRLNRILIAVGVIAFGLIIVDRLLSMYKTEDASNSSVALMDSSQDDQPGVIVAGEKTPIERSAEVDLQDEFGSRLVFVSLADPKYVITEDERRFDVGSAINEQTLLAGVTDTQVILEKDGELAAFDLSDLSAQ